MDGEWQATLHGMPFKSIKALIEALKQPDSVEVENLSIFGPHAGECMMASELQEGQHIQLYGPNPKNGVPNKWYARMVKEGGALTVNGKRVPL